MSAGDHQARIAGTQDHTAAHFRQEGTVTAHMCVRIGIACLNLTAALQSDIGKSTFPGHETAALDGR